MMPQASTSRIDQEPAMRRMMSKSPFLALGLWYMVAHVGSSAWAQDQDMLAVLEPKKDAKPNFGTATLAGDLKSPFRKNVVAGGKLRTRIKDVTAWVDPNPDFILDYTAGAAPLTITAESKADTTLMVYLPNGTWLADDDSGGNLNPLLKIERPASGRYLIWVGTYGKDLALATLQFSCGTSGRPVAAEQAILTRVPDEELAKFLKEWKIKYTTGPGNSFRWTEGDDEYVLYGVGNGKALVISATLHAESTLEQINQWNDEKALSRAILTRDNADKRRPRLESDLHCSLGVTPLGVRGFIDQFKQSLSGFKNFLARKSP
jgi:hypothetical protein